MTMTRVQSSAIIGYNYENNVLTVQLASKVVWKYANFPQTAFDAFIGASSKGNHFNTQIRNNPAYQASKVK